MMTRKFVLLLTVTALAMWVAFPTLGLTQEATPSVDPRCVPFENGEGCLPVAPDNERVDLDVPTFSNPTVITNPLFPIGAPTRW